MWWFFLVKAKRLDIVGLCPWDVRNPQSENLGTEHYSEPSDQGTAAIVICPSYL